MLKFKDLRGRWVVLRVITVYQVMEIPCDDDPDVWALWLVSGIVHLVRRSVADRVIEMMSREYTVEGDEWKREAEELG